MSNYTTGELAKAAGVTVRTVQYYDTRGILIPSDFSEGGRRLYTENDLKKLKVICFLRELGLSLNHVGDILEADNATKVINLLLEEQRKTLETEVAERKSQLDRISDIQKEMKNIADFSVENLGDVAYVMENKKKMKKVYSVILGIGLVLDGLELGAFIYAIKTGNWWLFAAVLLLMLIVLFPLMNFYHKYTVYICPECHEVFKPKKSEWFWANHTPKTRKLTCPCCSYKGFCVETYGVTSEEEKEV
ncbi:MAG: MerR family transcriptional regulator [Lachnospiraceae bacterium]|nr:MerR family transcriptional regulator [Lachnospiraceae bacterium]